MACSYRYLLLALGATYYWLSSVRSDDAGGDWFYFVPGADALVRPGSPGGGLHVYASMPFMQFGPVALLVAVPGRLLGPHHGWLVVSALCMCLGLVSIRLLELAAESVPMPGV